MSSFPENPESPKKQEIEARTSYAQSLLEKGLKPATVATMISARCHCSRSTAYKTIAEASNRIQKSDDGPGEEEETLLAPQEIRALLDQQLLIALANNDVKQATQLIKAIDTTKKWQGALQTTVNPFV